MPPMPQNKSMNFRFSKSGEDNMALTERISDFLCITVENLALVLERNKVLGRTQGESVTLLDVDEGRKRVLLIAASILAARKLAQWDGRPSPATESAIADAI